jgi:hypothetical protein
MNLHHLEWLVEELVSDPAIVVYEVLPCAAAQADRIIRHLCMLAGVDVAQAGDIPAPGRLRCSKSMASQFLGIRR